MLKNKEERKSFLLDDNNWNLVYENLKLGLRIYDLKFKDETSLIRFDNYKEPSSIHPTGWYIKAYRVLNRSTKIMNFYNDLNLNYIVDLIRQKELLPSKKQMD